jgi:hypothetical protein
MEISVVLFMRIMNHVKVSTEKPRDISRGSNRLQFIEKIRSELRDRGGVNIGKNEREVSYGGGEVNR